MPSSVTASFTSLPSEDFASCARVGDHAVHQLRRAGQIAAALRHLHLAARLIEPLLQLLRLGQLILLGLPRGGHGVGFSSSSASSFSSFASRSRDAASLSLLQRLALDLQLHDAAVELVQFLRLAVDLHAQPAARLVDQVDRLVRQEPVGDVAVRQRRRRDQRAIGDAHAVMQFVLLLDAAQDADRVLDRGSPTNTGWKRRASAASFSTCLRYSSSVVAPTQCSAPRASSGLIRLDASIAPSARRRRPACASRR
jgi:hypothetical protein